MDPASAASAVGCGDNQVEPRTAASWQPSGDQCQSAEPPPDCSDLPAGLQSAPVHKAPRPSSPALCPTGKELSAAGFLLRRNRTAGRFSEGVSLRRLQLADGGAPFSLKPAEMVAFVGR